MSTPADADLISGLAALATPTLSDAMDRLGLTGGLQGIVPVGSAARFAGPAFTARYLPAAASAGTVGDFVDETAPGDVVVIENAGRTHCTVWGGILTVAARRRGLAATVIDGVCRDVDEIEAQGYPVFSRGRFMVTGKGRVQVDAVQIPVNIAGVQVRPGDIVVGDLSGALAIPRERAGEVLAVARAIATAEQGIVADLEQGLSLGEARRRHGYHQLQQRQK